MPTTARCLLASVTLLALAASSGGQCRSCYGCRPPGKVSPEEQAASRVPDIPDTIKDSILIKTGQHVPLFQNLTLEEGFRKAKEQNRLFMIFLTPPGPQYRRVNQEFLERCQKSPSLRAYVNWRAVAIRCETLPPAVMAAIRAGGQVNDSTTPPLVAVIKNGQVEAVVGTAHKPPGPIRILYQSEFVIDKLRSIDPVWIELHQEANPLPKAPPEPEPFCTVDDKLAPIVRDPYPEEKLGALDRLDQARRMLKSGDYAGATGMYSWLWERASEIDPSIRPARLSAIVQDIVTLRSKHLPALQRFEKIRQARTERLYWAQFSGYHDWFVLNAIDDDPFATVEYLDEVINDPDEGGMLPPVEASVYRLLARREDFAKAWERPANAVARVNDVAARLTVRFPSNTSDTERSDYAAFAQQFLLDEGCRLYAATLVKGDALAAAQIAETLMRSSDTALTRLSLITTALAIDPPQPRAEHLEWLAVAESLSGAKRDDLRTRLALLLNPAPHDALTNPASAQDAPSSTRSP